LQDKGFTFTSTEQFLKTISPRLYKASQESLRKLLKSENFNDRIINELASIATLANYGQTVDINGFVGLVSLAGCTADLFSVKNGNKQVPIELLKLSGAKLMLNTAVRSITKDPNEPNTKNLVTYKSVDSDELVEEIFDYVIICFPLYKNVINEHYFKLDFDSSSQFDNLEMQLTNTYFIYGKVKLFNNLPINKYIQLHSVDPTIPYRTICVNLPCDYSNIDDKDLFKKDGHQVYKIFAEQDLNSEVFDKIFESDYKLLDHMPWLAYPKYSDNESSLDVVLDTIERSRVYYTNSFEWTSSCMEICSIGSRNVSNFIAKKESELVKRKFLISEIKLNDDSKYAKLLHKICGLATFVSIIVFMFSYFW
jgi:prenylcysteine oxidase/farnesylcysteine lyase